MQPVSKSDVFFVCDRVTELLINLPAVSSNSNLELIGAGADVNKQDEEGNTALVGNSNSKQYKIQQLWTFCQISKDSGHF